MSDVDLVAEENPFTPPEDQAKVTRFLDRFKAVKDPGEKPPKEKLEQAMDEIDRQTSTETVLTQLVAGHLSKNDAAKALIEVQQSLANQVKRTTETLSEKEKDQKDLEEKLTRDGLTGLRNKVWFENELKTRLADPKNNADNSKLWLVYMDLDRFKDVNSVYGHQTGDKVIKLIAQVKKESEEVARIGGEEFALIVDLNQIVSEDEDVTDEAKLRTILERYSTTYKELSENLLGDIKPGDHLTETQEVVPPRKISISFGLSRYQTGDDADVLKERASSAVLRAKNTGRDRAIASFSSGNELTYTNLRIPG